MSAPAVLAGTVVIRVRFPELFRGHDTGSFMSREYTYSAPDTTAIGDLVMVPPNGYRTEAAGAIVSGLGRTGYSGELAAVLSVVPYAKVWPCAERACPYCHTAAGQPCVTSARKLRVPHAQR